MMLCQILVPILLASVVIAQNMTAAPEGTTILEVMESVPGADLNETSTTDDDLSTENGSTEGTSLNSTEIDDGNSTMPGSTEEPSAGVVVASFSAASLCMISILVAS